jgi:hypothetical protein
VIDYTYYEAEKEEGADCACTCAARLKLHFLNLTGRVRFCRFLCFALFFDSRSLSLSVVIL